MVPPAVAKPPTASGHRIYCVSKTATRGRASRPPRQQNKLPRKGIVLTATTKLLAPSGHRAHRASHPTPPARALCLPPEQNQPVRGGIVLTGCAHLPVLKNPCRTKISFKFAPRYECNRSTSAD